MSQDKEEFDVNRVIAVANSLVGSLVSSPQTVAAQDENLLLAATIQKLVGAACAWKATRMTDVAADLAQELQQDMGTAAGHVQASQLVDDEEDDDDPPKSLEDLKDKLGLKRKRDKRW